MIELSRVPGDRRHFVHKRIGGAIKGFVSSGFNPLAAVGGFVQGGERAQPRRIAVDRSLVARPSATSSAQKEVGRAVKGGLMVNTVAGRSLTSRASSGCPPLMKRDPVTGKCSFFLGDRPGRDTAPLQIGPGTDIGEAVMGRYGAALVPGSKIVDRAVCLRGMQLGNDGLCYNKGQISNKERMWPRGRRPLLTGGDMRAISIASRAANRLTRTAVRLQEIGLIKKPVTRKPRKRN